MKHISVPLYESLKVTEMLTFAAQFQEVGEFFPSAKEVLKWPRQYTTNCLGIILGQRFIDWVDDRIEARNEKMAQVHNTMINFNPEAAAAFAESSY